MRLIVSIMILLLLALTGPGALDRLLHAGQPEEGAQPLQARDDYQAYCATCHGSQSKNQGSIAPGLALVDFTTPRAVASLTRAGMIDSVATLHSTETKQRWSGLGDDRIAELIDYIRASAMGPEPGLAIAMGPKTMADTGVGAQIYARSCSVCHGERGNAASWAKNSLYPPPRDFTRSSPDQLSRAAMISAVTYGVGKTAMVSFTTQLSDEEIAAVADFIRTEFMRHQQADPAAHPVQHDLAESGHSGLAEGHTQTASIDNHAAHGHPQIGGEFDLAAPFPKSLVGDAAKGHRFYDGNCAECHGLSGNGEGPRAYFMASKPRDFTAARAQADLNRPHLFQSVSLGIRQTEMAAWSKVLTDQQIADVAEYVFQAFIAPEEMVLPGHDAQKPDDTHKPHDTRKPDHSHDEHPHKKKL